MIWGLGRANAIAKLFPQISRISKIYSFLGGFQALTGTKIEKNKSPPGQIPYYDPSSIQKE